MNDLTMSQLRESADASALTNKLDAARRLAAGSENTEQADEAGKAFEKLLATQLVREMTATLSDGFFGEGPGADTFNGWLQEHLGAAIADDGSLGVAETVRVSILRQQAAADGEGGLA